MRDLKKRGLKAFAWDMAGLLSTRGVSFGVTLILARLLSPEDFGLVALIMVLATIADVFIDGGLGIALIQRRHVHIAHYSTAFYFNVLIGSAMGSLVFLFSDWIAEFYQQPQLALLLKAASPLFLLSSLGITQRVILRRELNNKRLSTINLIAALAGGVIAILAASVGYGVWALILQILSTSAVSGALFWLLSDWRPKAAPSWKALKGLWGFGLNMFLARVIDSIYTRLDYVIIGKLFPIATLGFFQRAKALNLLAIQYSSGSLMSVMLPVLSIIHKDLPRFRAVVLKGFKIVVFISFLFFGGLYVTSEQLIVLLFSEKWRQSADYFAILALSGVAAPVNSVLVNVLASRGKSKSFLRLELMKKGVGITNMAIGFGFGLMVYIYGLIAVSILSTAMNIMYAGREAGITYMQFVAPIVIQAAIAAVAILLVNLAGSTFHLPNLFAFLVLGAAYVLLYWLFNVALSTSTYHALREELDPLANKLAKKFRPRKREN